MTVLNFPSNPTVGQEYALNGVIYTWDSQKWTASEGGSTVSVEVGDTAPLNPSDGDLWWDSSKESGRLYVFYTDENSSQWVECSPAGGIEDPFWKRSGSTLSPLGPNDGVSVGNGNVELDVDGSAEFAGAVQAPRLAMKPVGDTDAYIQVINQTTGKIVGNYFGNGHINLSSDLSNGVLINLKGDDGSATFKGDVQVGGNAITGAETGITLRDSGLIQASRPEDTYAVFAGYLTGNSAATSVIQADGSATFAGNVDLGDKSYASAGTGGIYLGAAGNIAGTIYSYKSSSSSAATEANSFLVCYSAADTSSTKTEKIAFRGDGSASFAGTVTTGDLVDASADWTGGGVTVYDAGVIYAGRPTTGTLFVGRQSGNPLSTVKILADGSAEFAGTVQQNVTRTGSVEILLEKDNPSKYYPVTDDNGVVTTVYNGEVLDVKETLLTMKTKLTEREDRIEELTTRIIALENLIKGGNS